MLRLVRAFHPGAVEVVVDAASGKLHVAQKIHPEGLFEAVLSPGELLAGEGRVISPGSYRLRLRFAEDSILSDL